MNFHSSVIGKIFLVILCILLGMMIALGGLVGAVYMVLTQSTVGEIEEKVSDSLPEGVELDFSEEVKNQTILGWGQELLTALSDMNVTTIGQLEGLIGFDVISNALYETMGVEKAVISDSTFSNLGATITNSLTVETVSEKFDVAFPDMPLFKDSEFLSTPLADAFEDLTDKQLKQFVDISEDESNAVIVAIQDLTISELGGEELNKKIDALKLSDVIEITEGTSNSVLVALKDTTIGELGGEETDEIINGLFMCEILEINESSEKIMQAMKYASLASKTVALDKETFDASDSAFRASEAYAEALLLEESGYDYYYGEDGTPYVFVIENGERVYDEDAGTYLCYETKRIGEGTEEKNYPIKGINDKVKDTTIGDITEIDESDTLMWSLKDSTLSSISDDINHLFLDEVMEIGEDSSKTLIALKYASLATSFDIIEPSSIVSYSNKEKELKGYVYQYVSDGEGGYIPYIAKINENGIQETDIDGNYKLIKTKEYGGYYRPLLSIDEKVGEMLVGELIETPTSKTLQSLVESSLESKLSFINAEILDATTTAYIAENSDYSTYEKDDFIYKYSALGVAYICVTDDEGEAVKEGNNYKLYNTKFYNNKFVPLRGLDDKIKVITFGEVVDINETDPDTTPLMKSLKNSKIEEMDKTVNRLFLGEMIEIDNESAMVLQAIRYSCLQDAITRITKTTTDANTPSIVELNKELADYTYKYGKDAKGRLIPYICVMNGTEPTVENIEGVDYYKVYETKEFDGFNRPIVGLNEKLNDLQLKDVFEEEKLTSGVLSLLSADTKLNDISDEVAVKIQDSSLAKLGGVEIIDTSGDNFAMGNTPKEQRSFIWNNNLNGMLESIIKFVDNPIKYNELTHMPEGANYDLISAPKVDISGSYSSLSAFVEAYQGASYSTVTTQIFVTVNLTSNVSVTIDEELDVEFYDENSGLYFIPVFSLDGDEYTISIPDGVALAVMENGCQEVSLHQYMYAFDASNSGTGSGLEFYDGTSNLQSGVSVTTALGQTFIEYKKIN